MMIRVLFSGVFGFFIATQIQANSCDDALREASRGMVILAKDAQSLADQRGTSVDQLMLDLVGVAKLSARPPISKYLVGAVGRARDSGNLILGVNLEFRGHPLHQTVHGEQFVVSLAMLRGEKGLESLALSAAPCGHCRQWLNETQDGGEIQIFHPQMERTPLRILLPQSFGPKDLGMTSTLLNHKPTELRLVRGNRDSLADHALAAAQKSYAPYSKNPSGIALKLKDGTIITGSYAENVAFNPSLSPLQVALVDLVANNRDYSEILDAVWVEDSSNGNVSQAAVTRILLKSIAPDATFRTYQARAVELYRESDNKML